MNSNHAGSAATLQTIGSPYYAHAAVKSTPDRFIHRGIHEKNSSKMATSKAAFSIAEKLQNSVFFCDESAQFHWCRPPRTRTHVRNADLQTFG